MDLTSQNLQAILSSIFAVDPMYVVPKQGTWWNPQTMLSTAAKPLTWIAFRIDSDRPVDIAHFQGSTVGTGGNDSVQHRIASIALQFVGDKAHSLAFTVGHWIHNDNVRAQFALVEGVVLGDIGDITTTDFYQDAENNVKAYNVRLRVAWTSRIPTGQGIMPGVKFTGGTLVGV
jgi:hypothetical protein